jgi:hypothetical protein
MKKNERHREWDQVFASELEDIRRRTGSPTDDGLIGLAISGGGIRSATFSLGVIQWLGQRGFLKQFNY